MPGETRSLIFSTSDRVMSSPGSTPALAGTAAEVTPVCEIDGVEFRTGKDTLGARLQRAYLATVTGKDARHHDWLTWL